MFCSVMGMPLKTAVSLTCDSPMKARGPKKSKPRVKPGTVAIASCLPVFGSTIERVPLPDSSTQSCPLCQRGEWGMERLRVMISLLGTSIKMPPSFLLARQPVGVFVSPRAVTYFGLPSTIPMPLRWQRSFGEYPVMKRGFQRGTKLLTVSNVHKHEKRVFTTQSSLLSPYAISWTRISPVVCESRGI